MTYFSFDRKDSTSDVKPSLEESFMDINFEDRKIFWPT